MTPFSATLRSEWTKFVCRRSALVTTGLAVVLAFGLTTLFAVVVGATSDGWSADERQAIDPITFSLVVGIVSAVLLVAVGATTGTSEYTSRTIRLTLGATPRRGRVLVAKAVVVAAVTLVAGLVASTGMFLAAQAVFSSYGMVSTDLGDGDALRTVLTDGVLTPVLPVVALALGVGLRSTAGAVCAALALVFAPALVGGLLPRWWQEHVLAYLPGAAGEALNLGHLSGAPDTLLSPWVAALVTAAWVAASLVAAWAVLERRDA